MGELRWSPPSRADDGAWADLLASMEAVDRRGETYDLSDLEDEWSSVWANPATDATFVWDGSDLVAFAWLKAMRGEREANRISCWGGVRPSHRRRGLGTAVFEWSVDRAKNIAARLDSPLPTKVQVDAADHQQDLTTLATRVGLEPVRRFLEIARPSDLPLEPVSDPDGVDVIEWSEAIDDAVRQAHAETFADHWGSEPRSEEEWRQWYTGHRSFRPDLSRIAVDRASGEVAGYLLCAAYPQDWGDDVPVEAWIHTLGTRRPWRGRGVARCLLTGVLGLVAADATGFRRTILGVDADNPTGALQLYRSLAFEDVRAVTTLSRDLS